MWSMDLSVVMGHIDPTVEMKDSNFLFIRIHSRQIPVWAGKGTRAPISELTKNDILSKTEIVCGRILNQRSVMIQHPERLHNQYSIFAFESTENCGPKIVNLFFSICQGNLRTNSDRSRSRNFVGLKARATPYPL